MRQPQLGVTLTPEQRAKLERTAEDQGRSLSSVCAEAIEAYTDGWLLKQRAEEEPHKVFTVFKKIASQLKARDSGVTKRA